jgi:site-specific DNA recombinase
VTSTNNTPDQSPARAAGGDRRGRKANSNSTCSGGPQRTAAIYARVSSARQKKDETIASQTAALREHAAAAGLAVPEQWIFEDDGHSGATLARPALERLRDLVAGIGVDVVLCYSPDRLARKFSYQALLIEEFTRAGTATEFVKGPRGDSPEDQLMVQFQGMFAEYEKAQIMERYRRGKAHRAKAGSVNVLSGAPYGYRYVRKTPHAPAAYQVVAHEAVLVAELFRRYADEGVSIADLARWLGEQGALTRTGKTRWDRSVVWAILRNPAYTGQTVYGKTKAINESAALNRVGRLAGRATRRAIRVVDRPPEEWAHIPVPAIITQETFERAGQRLADNKRFASRNSKVPSLLQGLAACAGCWYAYYRGHTTTSAGNKIYYYRCLGSDDFRYEHGRVCANKPVRADYLDKVVWDHITALLADPALIRAKIDHRLDTARTADPVVHQRKRLTDGLTQATAAVTRMISAYQEELLTIDELRARIPDLRAREAALRTQIDALDNQLADRQVYLKLADDLEGFLTGLRASADVTQRQRVLRLLVKDVLIGPEKITIRHRIPVREHTPSTGPNGPALDTEGDHIASSPLRWGRGVPAVARQQVLQLGDLVLQARVAALQLLVRRDQFLVGREELLVRRHHSCEPGFLRQRMLKQRLVRQIGQTGHALIQTDPDISNKYPGRVSLTQSYARPGHAHAPKSS